MFFGVPLMNIPCGELFGIAGPNCASTLDRFGFPAGKSEQSPTKSYSILVRIFSDDVRFFRKPLTRYGQ